jgi:hypothetical protein
MKYANGGIVKRDGKADAVRVPMLSGESYIRKELYDKLAARRFYLEMLNKEPIVIVGPKSEI